MLYFAVVLTLSVLMQISPSSSAFVVHFSDMSPSMNRLANATSRRAVAKLSEANDIAKAVASEFEAEHGGCWQCIVIKEKSAVNLGWSLVQKKWRYATFTVGDWHIGLIQQNC